MSADDYTRHYLKEVLKPLDPHQAVLEMQKLYGQDEFTMICFEKPTDFCHRHLVAKWLQFYGYEVKEL